MQRALLGIAAALLAGCGGLSAESTPPATPMDPATRAAYSEAIDRVTGMTRDPALLASARRRGLSVVDLTWEDTGRAEGSSLGPNISDLTLQVRRPPGPAPRQAEAPWLLEGEPEATAYIHEFRNDWMPVIRFPNFTDRTADVRADRFFVRAGNERGGDLATVPLLDVLRDLSRHASAPASLGGGRIDLSAARDTHFLVSAQAVFLPIPRRGQAEFNPVLFNYQSAPTSPAVLVIVATREGASMTVIENRKDDLTFRGWGQELYFNDSGHRAAFTAERRSDVATRIAASGGPRSEADRSALGRGADVLAIVQVPLVHRQRGLLGGLVTSTDGYGYEFSEDPLSAGGFGPNDATLRVRPGPERAVLGHGPRLGPFKEGYGTRLVRDSTFPVRITVQFYKATSDGAASDADVEAIAKSLSSVYAHADFVGSLVVPEGDERRPTAWQRVPSEWFPW